MKQLTRWVGCAAFIVLWPLVWVYAPLTHRVRILVICNGRFLAVYPYFGTAQPKLPGGGVHFGESVRAAAKRELAEETGLAVDETELNELVPLTVYKEHGLLLRYSVYMYEVDSQPQIRLQKSELAACAWLPLESAHLPLHIRTAVQAYVAKHR